VLNLRDHINQMLIATKGSKFDISLESNTAKIANKFSSLIKNGDIVFFYGEIGVGKTTFIRYLINNFQKKKKIRLTEVTSPTFNLVNEYEIKEIIVKHFDLFRIKNKEETKSIGLFENSKDFLTLVEWPEKIYSKPKNRIELIFKYKKNSTKRSLQINFLREE